MRRAEDELLAMVQEGRVTQEPDMTSRVMHAIEILSRDVPGVSIELTVVPGMGPGAEENVIGADVLGVVRIELGNVRIAKGFLAQAKRDGEDGLHYQPPTDETYSHWTYRGDSMQLPRSGVVSVSVPSARLREQCDNMLQLSPDSFVLVFADTQIGVVSATSVHAHRGVAPRTKKQKPLGTKRLDDFILHVLDCFIGDEKLAAGSVADLARAAANRGIPNAMLLRVRELN